MSRTWVAAVGPIAQVALPVVGGAHGGHTHKVMGIVSSVQDNHVDVKTT